MAVYSFKCTECPQGAMVEAPMGSPLDPPRCPAHLGEMTRNYKADSPQLAISGLKRERDPNYRDSLFLPDADMYKSPTDPEGQKGLKKWHETHRPSDGNKNPRYPKGLQKAVW